MMKAVMANHAKIVFSEILRTVCKANIGSNSREPIKETVIRFPV